MKELVYILCMVFDEEPKEEAKCTCIQGFCSLVKLCSKDSVYLADLVEKFGKSFIMALEPVKGNN